MNIDFEEISLKYILEVLIVIVWVLFPLLTTMLDGDITV